MTRSQALAKISRLIKGNIYLEAGKSISSDEARAADKAASDAMKVELAVIDATIQERMIQAGIPELQRQRRELRKIQEGKSWAATYRKFSCGEDKGWCRVQRASGDTWEQVIAALEVKKSGAA